MQVAVDPVDIQRRVAGGVLAAHQRGEGQQAAQQVGRIDQVLRLHPGDGGEQGLKFLRQPRMHPHRYPVTLRAVPGNFVKITRRFIATQVHPVNAPGVAVIRLVVMRKARRQQQQVTSQDRQRLAIDL